MKRIACLTALLPVIASGAQQHPETAAIEPKVLEISDETPFNTQGFQLFRGGFRCDASGNVFFLPGLRGAERSPTAIVRASIEGGGAATWRLPSILRAPDADASVIQIATDTGGRLYALLSNRGPEGASQLIASIDDQGHIKSKAALSADEIVAYRFAVFDSGDFLVLGRRKVSSESRLAIMGPEGGTLRDVATRAGGSFGPRGLQSLSIDKLMFLEPSTDGNVYIVSEGGSAYAISASAEVIGTINLASPQTGARLFDLKISGRRMAALYNIEDGQPALRWIAIYDLNSRDRVATYGPVREIVMCYRAEGAYDRFLLLGVRDGRKVAFSASPR